MINFILYEDTKEWVKLYEQVIKRVMMNDNQQYQIIKFSSYTEKLEKHIQSTEGNIYILDISIPTSKSGLDLAREIRDSGDIVSQIIIVTSHLEMLKDNFTNRTLRINAISKYNDCENELFQTLKLSYTNLTKYKSLSFKRNGYLYNVLYEDVLYIEKENNDSIIHTSNNKYNIRKSIKALIDEISDPRFMITHKSYIVNLNKIDYVDFSNYTIHFRNSDKQALISRNYIKEINNRLGKKVGEL